jgi:hypothetical protein
VKSLALPALAILALGYVAFRSGAPGRALVLEDGRRDDAPFAPSSFLRFVKESGRTGRLETAVVRYRGPSGEEVSLVAAVHVADGAYYRELQELFRSYDALLYELVGTEEDAARLRAGETKSQSLLSIFQRGLKDVLKLEFQLDGVDYTQPNFVHADLDPETFFRLQRDRGESIIGLMLKLTLRQWQLESEGKASSASLFDLVRAFTSRDRATALKFLLAQELGKIEDLLAGIEEGKDGKGSVIVTERNKKALRVLKDKLRRGKRKLGIFYGAAHMPDIEERLVRELGFQKLDEKWLVAWDVSSKPKPEGERPPRGDDDGTAEGKDAAGSPQGGDPPRRRL